MNDIQRSLLEDALHYLDHAREQVDHIIQFSVPDPEADEGSRDSAAIDLLQYLRTAQYTIEAALEEEPGSSIEEDDSNDPSKRAN